MNHKGEGTAFMPTWQRRSLLVCIWRVLAPTALLGFTVAAMLALTDAAALGAGTHSVVSFGTEGSGDGQFIEPTGVAVDDATGDVLVVDRGNNRVERFTATGGYLSQFNGSAAPSGQFDSPTSIAVDNSGDPLDPSAGDVYVLDSGHDVIDKFSPVGLYEGQITEAAPGTPLGELDGIAVDSTGKVWVYQGSGEIDDFTDGLSNEYIGSRQSPYGTNPGFAVDSEDNLYVLRGSGQFGKLNSLGEPLIETVDSSESSTAAAVEPNSNDVYIDETNAVAVFGSSGELIERFGSEELGGGRGVALAKSTGVVYVADSIADAVDIFTPEQPTPPRIGAVYAKAVTATTADVFAEVDPGGEETSYYFQFGPIGCPEHPASCTDVPNATGIGLGSGFANQVVSAHLAGLSPDSAYYYRVVASNHRGHAESVFQTLRTGSSGAGAASPADARQWQLVSPPNKHGGHIESLQTESGVIQSSEAGDAIAYLSDYSTSNEPVGEANLTQLLSRRGAEGWATEDLATPHGGPTAQSIGAGQEYRMFSPTLASALVEPFELGSGIPLAPEVSERTVYVRDNGACEPAPKTCFRPLVTSAPGYSDVREGAVFGGRPSATTSEVHILGATPDLTHVILTSAEGLTAGSLRDERSESSLYEWADGHLTLVSILPDRAPANAMPEEAEAFLGQRSRDVRHAISSDGSRVVWETGAGSEPPHLYLRDTTQEETVKLDSVEAGASGAGPGNPRFQTASEDDSRIFFTDEAQLTAGSKASEGSPDLYEFEVARGAGPLAGTLRDLTADVANSGESADVQGGVSGASEDGDVLYFVADGVLASGATPGNCGLASNAVCNLYEMHNDGSGWETTFIATLSSGDQNDWEGFQPGNLHYLTSRTSPDGRYLAFMSERPLTGYDNRDAHSGEPDEEVFLYDSSTRSLLCASCNPTGARPSGVHDTEQANLLIDPIPHPIWATPGVDNWLAASVPGWTALDQVSADYQSRYLDDQGRLFFDSEDALAPKDVNGREDVYEFEPEGVGDCSRSSESFDTTTDGCLGLISSGTGSGESAFLDASASGDDVFFVTASQLVQQDSDESPDVYDAHQCTSAVPCMPTAAVKTIEPCATSDGCQGAMPPSSSVVAAPPSAVFSGPGNVDIRGAASPTKAQQLAKALATCRRKHGKRRARCETRARARYRPGHKASTGRTPRKRAAARRGGGST